MAIPVEKSEAVPNSLPRRQLLNHVVDERAKAFPDAVYAEIPNSVSTYDTGFRKVTYAALANAINGLAHWLHQKLGPGENFPTLVYMGPNDLRYNVVLLAATKAGYKVLLSSPRNSIAAHNHLFKVLDCHTMITTSPPPPGVSIVVDSCKLRSFEIPSVEELLSKTYPHFPYNKTYEEHKLEPLLVVHTSGSTGLPKPIMWNHEFGQSVFDWLLIEPPNGYSLYTDKWIGTRLFNLLPPFHAGGLYGSFLGGIYGQTTVIWPLAGVPPSAQLVMDGLKHTKVDCALLAPPFIEETAKSPELLDFLAKNLDSVFFAGGNISKAAGEKISKRIKLFMVIGMSEAGVMPNVRPADKWPTENWAYFHFNDSCGIELEHIAEDQYEAVLVRDPDPERTQPIFHVFPDLKEWRTKDLYTPHPSEPGLWLYRARADDIIVFLTGEKTNPTTMEYHIAHHPEVRSALVVGTLRFQAALLVEPATTKDLTTSERAKLIERLWPTIQEANRDCPHHAKIAKSHILFTDPKKPMERAGKGTVQRQPTLQLYAAEIDALYADADKMSASGPADTLIPQRTIDIEDSSSVESFIHELVASLLESSTFLNSDDFFLQQGMDSLQALRLTRSIRQSLAIPDLSISTVYKNPSVALLTQAISHLSAHHNATKVSFEESRQQAIKSILEEYKHLVDAIVNPLPSSESDYPFLERIVVLTGSTGALGSYMLEVLLRDSSVSHVYCLNRASDSRSLQLTRSKARNLQTAFPENRVTFLTADLSKERFGLDSDTYEKLCAFATDIIHNAWPVNFNLSLAAFKPSLSGLVNIIAFAAAAPHSPSVMFLSSISSVASYKKGRVPEAVIEDTLVPLPMGYGESKYLAERILDYAALKFPALLIDVARVGQVAGPANSDGEWNRQEWFPSIVLSSLHLGMIPESLGKHPTKVDWVPIDLLATALVELTFNKSAAKQEMGATVLHPMNPQPTSWSSLLKVVITEIAEKSKKELKPVPFTVWLQYVRSEAENLDTGDLEEMLKVNPAIELLSFYEGLAEGEDWPVVDTTKAVERSKQLQELKGVKPEWMKLWVKTWIEN